MTDDFEATEGGPSRRQLIKGAAVGSALVWTAPVLSSVTSPAAAASAADCGQGWACADGGAATVCGQSAQGNCLCYAETAPGTGKTGDSFCGQDFFCNAAGPTCNPDGSCPPGYQCQSGCCGENICAPLCDTVLARTFAPAGSGATNSGR
jgi:hypothetical protein